MSEQITYHVLPGVRCQVNQDGGPFVPYVTSKQLQFTEAEERDDGLPFSPWQLASADASQRRGDHSLWSSGSELLSASRQATLPPMGLLLIALIAGAVIVVVALVVGVVMVASNRRDEER